MDIKINIKREQISKEEIAANKNFGEVLQSYKMAAKTKARFYKATWFYAGLSTAAAIVVAVIIYITPAGNKGNLAGAEAFIKPPFEKVKISPSLYSMNADAGTTITSKRGTVIKIPPKSFVDKSGKPVYGKVDIVYRELNDPVDFFLSGIPMNYDSAGIKYTFESAGMIEIHASQLGKELELSPEKELAIALATHQPGKSFNLYKLDAEKQKWEYKGREEDQDVQMSKYADAQINPHIDTSASASGGHISELAALDTKLEHAQLELKKSEAIVKRVEATKPFEPKQETKGHHRFALSPKNIKDFPELAFYKEVLFKASDENKNFDENSYNIDWQDAELSKKGVNYILTLRKDDTKLSCIVHPVFEGEGYLTAQKIYQAKLEEYEESLVERKAIEGEKQQELVALTEAKEEVSHQSAGIPQNSGTAINNPGNLTFHNFAIHSCGIWNLDNPTLLPQGAMVNARFTDEQGKELKFASGKIYLVEKGRNVLFSFEGSSLISYNPEKQNTIWGVTADNKLAIFSYDDFKAIGKQSGDYTFKMKVSEVDMADEAQVEYYLNI